MNPIQHLLDWRLDIFLKEYNIKLELFNKSIDISKRKQIFKNIAKQLTPCNFYSDTERKNYINYGFWIIKNVIWKNITSYTLTPIDNSDECELCITRIYSNHQETFIPTNWKYMDREMILNRTKRNIYSDDNLNKLLNLIINHFMLIDIIITEFALADLCNIVKQLIYHTVLLKN